MSEDYEIGYRKPPKRTQFKPGQSGNPRGRPKKKGSGRVDVAGVLNEPVTITQAGVRRKMAPFEAGVRKLAQQGLKKDLNAILAFLKLCRKYDLIAQPER